ncbi:MAG: hypothetical protein CTY22_05035, partial [Methylomonas sp.]
MKKIIQKMSTGLTDASLQQTALAHYAARRYKEASDAFKDLLKQPNNAEYKRYLADCYLQRAKAMAGKALFKEACVLWENYTAHGEAPLQARDSYVLWLLASKNSRKAYAALKDFDARQLDEDYPDLAACLSVLLVTGASELLPQLPPDSAVAKHWHTVRDALEAYRNGERERCNAALKNLPFRSPFRDLRTLLKLQWLDVGALEHGSAMASKIPATSPYRPLADACLAYWQTGADFIAAMAGLDLNQRRIIGQARGLSAKHLNLLETLVKQKTPLTDKMRFELALNHRDLFGTDAAQAYCLQYLVDHPGGHKEYLKCFPAKNSFEDNRLQALLANQSKNSYDAVFFWHRCIDSLQTDRPANDKKIALILRHMAERQPYREAADSLIDSLEYDPNDKQSHLKLLRIYEDHLPNLANYEHWLERSLERFPTDTDLLVRAAQSAARRKSFKKAAAYAKTLLKIDPVNTLAKQLLFSNHMAHARRLLKTGKFHLVEKEIQAAQQLSLDKNQLGQADLLRGFYLWQAEDKKQGVQHIVDKLTKLNADPVAMQFQAQIEAGLLGVPTTALTRALPAFKDYLLSAPELERLMTLIDGYDRQLDDRTLLMKALDKIKAPLKKSVEWLLDHEALLQKWCETLATAGHFELLKHSAKLANRKWWKPVWLYYQRLAECQGDARNLNFMDLFGLQQALQNARNANDKTAVMLLTRLIEQARMAQHPLPSMAFDSDESDQNNDDVLEDLFGQIPDRVFERIAIRARH